MQWSSLCQNRKEDLLVAITGINVKNLFTQFRAQCKGVESHIQNCTDHFAEDIDRTHWLRHSVLLVLLLCVLYSFYCMYTCGYRLVFQKIFRTRSAEVVQSCMLLFNCLTMQETVLR